jgi:hypothetical protein
MMSPSSGELPKATRYAGGVFTATPSNLPLEYPAQWTSFIIAKLPGMGPKPTATMHKTIKFRNMQPPRSDGHIVVKYCQALAQKLLIENMKHS